MSYPDRLADVERLIAQHRGLKNQSLQLALYYAQDTDPNGVYLLEVASQFGGDEVSDDKELFEISYGSTEGFPLPPGGRLDILLTNPAEMRVALEQGWASLSPILAAVREGQYQVMHDTEIGRTLLTALQKDFALA